MRRLIATALIALAFAAGYLVSPRNSGKGEREVLYYVDPMNPAFQSPEPGIAPCGMALEPVYAHLGPEDPVRRSPGTVEVRPDRLQLIGVTVEKAGRRKINHTLRLVGWVTVDETREYTISAVTRGWVKELTTATTGSLVKKSEYLGAFYAPEIFTPQYTYIHTYDAYQRLLETGRNRHDNMQGGGQIAAYEKNLVLAEQTLINLGMPREQLKVLQKTGEVEALVELRSPTDGFILSRNITLGQWFNIGDKVYRIADLSEVWIMADAFEGDEKYLTPGKMVEVRLPATNNTFMATVSEVLPMFDGITRTLKVRLEAENPDYVLRPDMFVDVEIPVELGPAIVVPEEAVLDSGKRKLVFVEVDQGVYEPRQVKTGWRYGGRVEIKAGVMEGESIVTSGNFLLDSESRMKLSSLDIRGTPDKCVVCDMDIDQELARAAGRLRTYRGRVWYFCSERCAEEFDADPRSHIPGDVRPPERKQMERGQMKMPPSAPTPSSTGHGMEHDAGMEKKGDMGRMQHGRMQDTQMMRMDGAAGHD